VSEEIQNKVAMVIMAHPDDAEFSCAGTVAKWVREGWEVYYVICTDAGSGGPDEATEVGPEARRQVTVTRQAEQRAAGTILGLKDVIFLNYRDGELQPTLEFRREIVRLLRTYKPYRVICQSPERSWSPQMFIGRYHPDHRACGEGVISALYPASQNPWDFPELLAEGLAPHKVKELYVVGAPVVNHWVDISETLDLRIEALLAHASQFAGRTDEITQRVRERLSTNPRRWGGARPPTQPPFFSFGGRVCLSVRQIFLTVTH
jgi:LmbE family N-acetylglucosaminyl deacetylase